MPHRFYIRANTVCGDFTGILSLDYLTEFRRWILAQPEFSPEMNQLCDLSGVTEVTLQVEEVKAFVDANIFSPHSRRAIVATDKMVWGMSRVFAAYCEIYGRGAAMVFADRPAALDWLGWAVDPSSTGSRAAAGGESASPLPGIGLPGLAGGADWMRATS